MNDANIAGGRALDELLKTLPVKLETNVMRSALRAGAKVYLDQVKQNIPAVSGDLRASARITTRKGRDGKVSASVKVGNSRVYYAQMVEFGTRAHTITARGMTVNGTVVRTAEHPGSRPHPFMRPAADEKFNEAIAAVEAQIRKRLSKEGLQVPDLVPAGEAEA